MTWGCVTIFGICIAECMIHRSLTIMSKVIPPYMRLPCRSSCPARQPGIRASQTRPFVYRIPLMRHKDVKVITSLISVVFCGGSNVPNSELRRMTMASSKFGCVPTIACRCRVIYRYCRTSLFFNSRPWYQCWRLSGPDHAASLMH